MKRYFVAALANLPPAVNAGEYHWIDLGSHGAAGAGFAAVVMVDGTRDPDPAWAELPHLLDGTTTIAANAAQAARLGVVGVTGAMTGFLIAKALASIHPAFKP